MTASSLENISISNHPTKGLQRKADLISFIWNVKDRYIKQQYAVYELDLNGDKDIFSRYEVELYASDAWLVNPLTGELIGEVSEIPEEDQIGLMGEYTFFLLYAENSIELYPLLLSKALSADTDKQKFDRV